MPCRWDSFDPEFDGWLARGSGSSRQWAKMPSPCAVGERMWGGRTERCAPAEEHDGDARLGVLGDGLPDRGAERLDLVGALPGRVDVGAAEVAEGGGRLVDRAAQIERLDDARRAQVEVLADQLRRAARWRPCRCRRSRRRSRAGGRRRWRRRSGSRSGRPGRRRRCSWRRSARRRRRSDRPWSGPCREKAPPPWRAMPP